MAEFDKLAARVREAEAEATDRLAQGGSGSEVQALLHEYLERIRDVRKALIEEDFPQVHDRANISIIENIAFGKPLSLQERLLARHPDDEEARNVIMGGFDEDEHWDLFVNHLTNWIGFEYVDALCESGVMILHAEFIPRHLRAYVREARQCYALMQHIAMVCMCRVILEICLNDIYNQRFASEVGARTVPPEETAETLFNLVEEVLADDEELKSKAHKIRRRCNEYVHPFGHPERKHCPPLTVEFESHTKEKGKSKPLSFNVTVVFEKVDDAKEMLQDTFSLVSDIYYRYA